MTVDLRHPERHAPVSLEHPHRQRDPGWRRNPIVRRKSPKEIKKLAREVITRQTFFCWASDDAAMRNAFMLMTLLIGGVPESQLRAIGGAYAPMSDAMPTGVNGYPMFTSMGFLHINDAELFQTEYRRMREALGVEDD